MSEEHERRDDALQGLEHVEAIVDEVREPQLLGVEALVRAPQTEADVLARESRASEETLPLEPATRERLDAGSALGDEPDVPVRALHEQADGLEGPGRRRCRERALL